MRDDKGLWLPGQSPNPKGRPAGSVSRAKQWQDEFFEGDRKKAIKDWDKLSASQRWTIRAKFWDFSFPKLRSEAVDLSIDGLSQEAQGKIVAEVLTKVIDENEPIKLKSPDGRDNDTAGNS